MKTQPGFSHRPHAPGRTIDGCGSAPQICIMVSYPATSAPLNPCRARPSLGQILDHRDEGLDALSQIALFGGPVVHLRVDIDGVLAVPRRIHALVPETLQVRSLATGAGARDEKISSELKVKSGQLRIIARPKAFNAFIRGKLCALCTA